MSRQISIFVALFIITGLTLAEQTLTPIESIDILAKIQNGSDVNLSNCIIKGNFNTNMLNLSKNSENKSIINSSIFMENCIIDGNFSLFNVEFGMPINMNNTTFNEVVLLNGSQFDSYLFFGNIIFKKQARLSHINFLNDANFNQAYFGENSDFSAANFQGLASFNFVKFNKTVNFTQAQFGWYVFFYEAVFGGKADFYNCIFFNVTRFTNSIFVGDSNFNRTQFKEFVFFDNTLFNENAYFLNSLFEGANFIDSWFQGNANFKNTNFNESARFQGVRFDRDANFRETRFGDHIYLNGVLANGDLIVNWDSFKGKLIGDRPVYMKLVKHFKDEEDKRAEDECYYFYRFYRLFGLFQEYHNRPSLDVLVDFMWWISCGFGVMPSFTILLSVLLILIFGIVYWKCGVLTMNDSLNVATIDEAIFFSISLFFKWMPQKCWTITKAKKRWKYITLIEVVLGMILLILFVITLNHASVY